MSVLLSCSSNLTAAKCPKKLTRLTLSKTRCTFRLGKTGSSINSSSFTMRLLRSLQQGTAHDSTSMHRRVISKPADHHACLMKTSVKTPACTTVLFQIWQATTFMWQLMPESEHSSAIAWIVSQVSRGTFIRQTAQSVPLPTAQIEGLGNKYAQAKRLEAL